MNSFEHKGRDFIVEHVHDDSHGAPWKECDGHGVVSESRRHPFGYGTKPSKAPGERILYWDRGNYAVYDMQATMKIARRDGWGLGKDDEAKLAQTLGRMPTRGDIVAAAVEADFQFLRGWCNDQWHYVGVVVKLDDEDQEESESIWGVESCADEYLIELQHELADEICARLDDQMAADIAASPMAQSFEVRI